ncbi:hypothetical protein MVEN_00704000 [Mycena venus]|uniref:Zn(2)-C6 fungal-type domain-containing protein n=1 Tax=Mycena venus TaxID=2733690 RepID=A0A8H6YIT9_9AGAR|nr:hypothetical protein MVEN_00704000 [Mycena venus]
MQGVMSNHTSPSKLRGRPSSYLHKACENCRRRKIKCDSVRPHCLPCRLRPPRSLEPCRYSHTPPDHTAQLASPTDENVVPRIQQGNPHVEQIYLSDPYPMKDVSLAIEPGYSVLPAVPVLQTAMEEPPQFAVKILIDAFLGRFSEDDFFFLEPLQFRQSALLPLPYGHPERPSPALLSAVYLWGTRISSKSPPPEFEYTEEDLLALTVHNLAHDIHLSRRMTHHTSFLVQTIQAEVLLSLWYLNAGETLLGRYHSMAATSFVGALHSSLLQFVSLEKGSSTPADGAEFAEREKVLWAVIVLDKMWLAASVLPSNSPASPMASSHTIPPTIIYWGHVPFGLLATASLLFERSVILSTAPIERQDFAEFLTLDQQLDAFQQGLPSMESPDCALPTDQTLLAAHSLANVASIRLHAPHIPIRPESTRRAFVAADRVISDFTRADVLDWNHANPIFGPFLSAVCTFYISHYHLGPHPQIVANLEILLNVLSTLSQLSPLIHHCYAVTQIYWSATTQGE